MSESPSHLPQELSWEQMEGGILAKMDALESEERKKRRPFWLPWGRAVLVLGLIVLALGSMLALYVQREDGDISHDFSLVSTEILEEDCLEDTEVTSSFSQGNAAKVSDVGLSLSPKAESTTSLESLIIPVEHTQPNALPTSVSTRTDLPDPVQPALISSYNWSLNSLLNKGIDLIISPSLSGVVDSVAVPDLPGELELANTPQKARIALLGGGNIWDMGFGKNGPDRADFETGIWSYQGQFSYVKPLKKGWVLMLGLQYQKLESRFERTYKIENYELTLTDTVVERQNNILTGKITELRGDVTLTVPADRIVRHHNATELIQIPLAIGKSWQRNHWQGEILLGGSLNILSRNQGRTQHLGELQFYKGAQTDFLRNQWNVNGMMSGRITYLLNAHWGITTGVQVQRSLTNWSREPGTSMHPLALGLQLGLTRQL